MPQWSVAEWRARIGGSWLAIGRPFKTKSSFSRGAGWVRRVLTMNQVVTMTIMMIILIGTNLALCALVNRGYHRPIIDLLRFGLLSHWSLYLLNSVYLVVIAISSCSLSLYSQFFPSNIKKSLRQFTCDLKQGLQLVSQLLLLIIDPLINPLLWLLNFVGNELNWMRAVSVVRISLASDRLSTSEASCSVDKDEVELSKRAELLRRLALARALLDIVLSVAVHVIIFKLLMSGDVEKNPGPGELDYNTVDSSQVLDEDDLSDVIEEVVSIKPLFYELGRSLRLKIVDLDRVRDAYSSAGDIERAIQDVLQLWLDQKYNRNRFGPPTWRMLVEAVDKETGGNNHELAKKIASKHLADGVTSLGPSASVSPSESQGSTTEEHKENLPVLADAIKSPAAPSTSATLTKDGDLQSHDKSPFSKVMEGTKSESCHDHLSIGDMREILDILWNYRAKWNLIGIQLGIDLGTLDAINVDKRKAEDALVEVIKLWLCQVNPKPTRFALSMALESKCLAGEVTSTQGCIQKDDNYAQYLKSLYKVKTLASFSDDQWPPPCTDKVFRLAMIKSHMRRGDFIDDAVVREKTISGKVDDVLQRMVLIELKDIFEDKDQQGESTGQEMEAKKVLMEGAPGSGKSTLSFHMCRQWTEGHLFQGYELVILVRLREIADAKRLAELLPQRNEEMGREIEDTITASDGENVLFILDGWDELPYKASAYSFILNLVKGIKLPKSSIIVTSRPTSSASLHTLVHLQIEILGFTKDELQQYFRKCLQNSVEAAERLLQRIKQNPIVEGTCYLPLNASILVHLFKCKGNVLPTTQYGIFTEHVCTCIFRHLKKTRQDIDELKSLDELPPDTAAEFKDLCKIAYDCVMQDVVIFDLGPNFNTLGLLQGVESLAVCGKSCSYNFLHLSIQELLCAIHMANELDEKEQTEQFKKLFGQPRFMLVFQFFAAKTKLKTSGISEVVTQVAKKCSVDVPSTEDRTLLVSLMHCLFEAQDSSLCQLVADELKQKLTLGTWNNGIRLNPADCYYLGYFLTFCKGFEVSLARCSIGDDHCKSLFRKEQVYDLLSLNLSENFIGPEGAMAVAAAMTANLQVLSLDVNSIGPEGAMAVAAAMKTAINLRVLYLSDNSIGNEGAMAVAAAMTANLRKLNLRENSIGNEGAMAMAAAMTANLQVLNLTYNDIGEEGEAAIRAAAKETGTGIFVYNQQTYIE